MARRYGPTGKWIMCKCGNSVELQQNKADTTENVLSAYCPKCLRLILVPFGLGPSGLEFGRPIYHDTKE